MTLLSKIYWYQSTVKGGREGTDLGFDLELTNMVKEQVTIPVIASNGAGCPEHFSEVFKATDVEAALAAGIFHRKEVRISDVKKHLQEEGTEIR